MIFQLNLIVGIQSREYEDVFIYCQTVFGNLHQNLQQSQKFLSVCHCYQPVFEFGNQFGLVNGEAFVVLHVPFDEVHHEECKSMWKMIAGKMVENGLVEEFSVVLGSNEGAFHEIENDNLIRFK